MRKTNREMPRRAARGVRRRGALCGAGIIGIMGLGLALTVTASLWHRDKSEGLPVLMAARYQTAARAGASRPQGFGTGNDAPFSVSARFDVDTRRQAAGANGAAFAPSLPDNVTATLARLGRGASAWARFEGTPVWARVKPEDGAVDAVTEATAFYAARSGNGAGVIVANRGTIGVETNVRVRLPRGVYKIERLTLGPDARVAESLPERTSAFVPASINGQAGAVQIGGADAVAVRLERLEGANLAASGVVAKRFTLAPGQICVYRYADQARLAAQNWQSAQIRLHDLAAVRPNPARRLRRMMQEGEKYLSGLNVGGTSARRGRHGGGGSGRLTAIHHLLLVTGQAASLARNDMTRRVFPQELGATLLRDLDTLTDALAETSATILGLVPTVACASEPEPTVTVALANTGGTSVDSVKLGLNTTLLPSGVTCTPSDPAYFGTLRPGQTARAVFRLHGLASPGSLSAENGAGDVSYFKAEAPAHLHPRLF